MNEPEEGVAPTDSRNRPDQRLMEEGKWDEANRVKIMLEEKQRLTRKHRESEVEKAKEEGKCCLVYHAIGQNNVECLIPDILFAFTRQEME